MCSFQFQLSSKYLPLYLLRYSLTTLQTTYVKAVVNAVVFSHVLLCNTGKSALLKKYSNIFCYCLL